MDKYQRTGTWFYCTNVLFPLLLVVTGAVLKPLLALGVVVAWLAFVAMDPVEFKDGRPVREQANTDMIKLMREFFSLRFHRTETVQKQLMTCHKTGQSIFAVFPHGVNSDFRYLMDGMMYDHFADTFNKSPIRTLAASVLFKIPGVRQACLATSCVDASRKTAEHNLKKGRSLLILPGGEDEQIATIYGKERVFLRKRMGFIKLAIRFGVPVTPAYVFGSSDCYYTSSLFLGLRKTVMKALRICLPIYWGQLGCIAYPNPLGFPLRVPQNIVFGDPILFPQDDSPEKEVVSAAHAQFVTALTKLFNDHKKDYGFGDRELEVL